MYQRLVEQDWPDPWLATGVVTSAQGLLEDGRLDDRQHAVVRSVFDWLNSNLDCPPFAERIRSGEWSRDAVAWFHEDAWEPMLHLWDLARVLRDHGLTVLFLMADDPGPIVYRDPLQVVAEAPDPASAGRLDVRRVQE